jgi:hypothetical protein
LRGAGGDAHGSWHTVMEHLFHLGRHEVIALADTAGDSTALGADPASPNPGKGGTFSRFVAACLGSSRPRSPGRTSLARRLSLGVQPRTTT